MLYVNKEGKSLEVHHGGDPIETAVEILSVVGTVYNALKNNNPTMGEIFRMSVYHGVSMDSPVWDPEDNGTYIRVPKVKKDDAPTGQSQGTA